MSFVEPLSAMALLIAFFSGVASGLVGGASLASLLEERGYSLLSRAPGPLHDGARVFYGFSTRGDGYVTGAPRGTTQSGRNRNGGNGDSGT
jgi:hypothetical protein